MKDSRLTGNQKVMLYLVNKMGKKIEGRKKLMKLMFLIEHYDTEKERLTRQQTLGNEFIIYRYGVFSFDVLDEFRRLENRDLITAELPIKVIDIDINLDTNIQNKIDQILTKFGDETGGRLEVLTLKMLGYDKESKKAVFGKDVKELISEN